MALQVEVPAVPLDLTDKRVWWAALLLHELGARRDDAKNALLLGSQAPRRIKRVCHVVMLWCDVNELQRTSVASRFSADEMPRRMFIERVGRSCDGVISSSRRSASTIQRASRKARLRRNWKILSGWLCWRTTTTLRSAGCGPRACMHFQPR